MVGNTKQVFFWEFFLDPAFDSETQDEILWANYSERGQNHPAPRSLESITKAPIEFGQCSRSILLILNRKIFPVAPYLPAAHLE
jgi:hypothetical protein